VYSYIDTTSACRLSSCRRRPNPYEIPFENGARQTGLARHTSVPYHALMFEFVETPFFTKALTHYLSDDEYAELQGFLTQHPEAGDIVRGSGGVRKLRWGVRGRGKRGGLRVIYYLHRARSEIWLITLYGKNVRENIPAHVLKRMKEAIEDG